MQNSSNSVYRFAVKEARSINSDDLLYCLFFSHGLMKVGATSRGKDRLDEIMSHGLLTPLLKDFIFVPCNGKEKFSAESIALDLVSKKAQRIGKEVFRIIDADSVRSALNNAIDLAEYRSDKPMPPSDFDGVADATPGFRSALRHLALERVFPVAWKDACAYVLQNEDKPWDEFERGMLELHWATVEQVPHVMRQNAVLLAKGASRDLRKELLTATVESRRAKLTVINGGAS